jgi:hypothetical protein
MTQSTQRQASFMIKDAVALLIGLGLLIAGFAVITRLPGWIEEYGSVPVYLAYFLLMSVGGRLFWKGADAVVAIVVAKFRKPKVTATESKQPAHAG